MPTNAIQNDAVQAIENTITDAVLWYKIGIYGDIGYGVPNPSNDVGSLNPSIIDIVNLIGRNLFMMMHHEDVDLSTPPSINTLVRVHQLYIRAGQVISGRAVPPGQPNLETEHVQPAGEVFRVFPVPYFKVRNPWLKRWAGLVMTCVAECMQHTENRKTMEISTTFGGMVGKYMERVYQNMAIELFGKSKAHAEAVGFRLTDEDFAGYDPATFFTPVEMIDTVPALDNCFTEDRKAPLAGGIAIHELPKLQPWPANLIEVISRMRAAREGTINPDTGQLNTDSSRLEPAPVFPAGSAFV